MILSLYYLFAILYFQYTNYYMILSIYYLAYDTFNIYYDKLYDNYTCCPILIVSSLSETLNFKRFNDGNTNALYKSHISSLRQPSLSTCVITA